MTDNDNNRVMAYIRSGFSHEFNCTNSGMFSGTPKVIGVHSTFWKRNPLKLGFRFVSHQSQDLVSLQEYSCQKYADKKLFGTRQANGKFTWTTYSEFASMVDGCRAALHKLGVKKDDKVGIISNNRLEWAISAYATYGLGAQFVPMYEAQLPKDWKFIIEDSGASTLLVSDSKIFKTTSEFVGKVGNLKNIVVFDDDATNPNAFENHMNAEDTIAVPSIIPLKDDLATILYTSGTTGLPKGVELSHYNIVSNINSIVELYDPYFNSTAVTLSFLPWSHAYGQTVELHCGIGQGASIGIARGTDTLLADLVTLKPTCLFAVPALWNRIYDGIKNQIATGPPLDEAVFGKALEIARERSQLLSQGKKSLWNSLMYKLCDMIVFKRIKNRFGGRLQLSISGGASLSKEVQEFFLDIGIVMVEGYGLTETAPILAAAKWERTRELQGYHNNPKATEEVLFKYDGKVFFKTGDLARLKEDGTVRITGRVKELYKLTNGKYVAPGPIEDKLKRSKFVHQIFIYGENLPHNVAIIVPDFAALKVWIFNQGLDIRNDKASIVADEYVKTLIREQLNVYGKDIKHYEMPKAFKLVTEEFTMANDLLTPKLSMKRRNIREKYKEDLKELYGIQFNQQLPYHQREDSDVSVPPT